MHETREDLEVLQQLLDHSMDRAGPHLASILTRARTLTAADLADRLVGMRLLVLATVTADGRPLGGPVDGIFYRGSFYFGSSADSVRFRHIARRPHVSATHLTGEEFAVTVHGRAVMVDAGSAEHAGFRRTLLDVYVPRYGPEWESFLDSGVLHARIAARRMFVLADPALG